MSDLRGRSTRRTPSTPNPTRRYHQPDQNLGMARKPLGWGCHRVECPGRRVLSVNTLEVKIRRYG